MYSSVHAAKLAQARPRPGLGTAQVLVVSTLPGYIANVDTNLGPAQEATLAIARNVSNKHDCPLVGKYLWKRKSLDLSFATCSVDKAMLNVGAELLHPLKCLLMLRDRQQMH